jgi:hypothetical protein
VLSHSDRIVRQPVERLDGDGAPPVLRCRSKGRAYNVSSCTKKTCPDPQATGEMRIGNDIRVCDVSLSEGEGSPAVAGQGRIRGIQSTSTPLNAAYPQEHDKRETIRRREVDRETRAAIKERRRS